MCHLNKIFLAAALLTISVAARDQPLFSSEFIWDFFKATFDERRNVAISPFSIRLGMTMLAHAVTDRYTLRQMIEKLHLPGSVVKATDQYRRMLRALGKDQHLQYGTKMYAFGNDIFNPTFAANVATFNASVERHSRLNMTDVPQLANSWARATTSGMVGTVLSEKDLTPNTRMILLNAVAFACKWEHQFNVNSTKLEMFNAYGNGKLYMTDFMNLPHTMLPMTLHDRLMMKAIELPFQMGSDYSLLIVMPLERDGNMTEMVGKLNHSSFKDLYDSLVPMRVSVKLPRVRLANGVNVNSVFRKLHLTAPFEWSIFQIFKDEKLTLDKVKHSVTVLIDEEGVRAAAVSAFTMVTRSASLTFDADRPFVFAILKKSQQFPLFVGHFAYPSKASLVKP
ncbi:uncharacterized protein LOC135706552 [Ochlerotatus camptorhynchus]|uniref:uncharacterized protein LOC135706552 n=1 Tax=Ochlerotatus camptorhynchus TaxID=644619 RepID=UPI0031D7B7AA